MNILSRLSLALITALFIFSISVSAQTNCDANDYQCKVTENMKRVSANPNDTEAYYNLGWAYHKLGNNDQAIANLNKYISLKPENKQDLADGYLLRGNSYKDSGAVDLAISDYTTAIALSPTSSAPYVNRGNGYRAKKNFVSAVADFTKAMEVDPTDSESWYNRGIVYQDMDQGTKAIADYDKYISMNTDNKANLADGYSNRGLAYVRLGNLAQGLKDYTIAIQTYPKSTFYKNRAYVYRQQGKISLAEADEQTAESLLKN